MDLSRLNSIIATITAHIRCGTTDEAIISKVAVKYSIQPQAVRTLLTGIRYVTC